MADGVAMERTEGTPQGGPLSPLLANLLLDEVDKELEKRGHLFVRYADDCKVYVRSRRAGERVMAALERMYAKLRLKVNREKSKVELAHKRSLLSYSFRYARGGAVACRVAPKALRALKQRVRLITRRSGGRSMRSVVAVNRRWWHRAAKLVHAGLTARYYDRLGVPRLADNLNLPNRRMRTRMSGGVAGE